MSNITIRNEIKQLIDELGLIEERLERVAPLVKRAKQIKEYLKEQNVADTASTTFQLTVKVSFTDRLDNDAVKNEMGLVWYADHCKSTKSVSFSTKRRKGK